MIDLIHAYRALSDIYMKGSWLGEAIKRQGESLADKATYRLVCGVVEREFLSEYRIACLVDKPPKPAVKLLLKMGMCLLDEFAIPDHAVVNRITETAKTLGKSGVSGFINAVLRRYARVGRELYPTDPDQLLSVRSNRPLWLVKRYIGEMGRAAESRLTEIKSVRTHIRPSISFGKDAFKEVLSERHISYEETAYGFYIGETGAITDLIGQGKATVMSWSSLDVCANIPYEGGDILDLCAAPGGKSVWLAERYGAKVVACDMYEHRVELIEKYAARMHISTLQPMVWDSCLLREEWRDSYSVVLLDAPCSGFGSLSSNPDVVLHRQESDLVEIIKMQKQLIAAASEYVRQGGALVYATCSDLPSEDTEVVRALLTKRTDFALEKEEYTHPSDGDGECYYYAVLRKK